jgi:cell wall-associated NlpC family hydrolase
VPIPLPMRRLVLFSCTVLVLLSTAGTAGAQRSGATSWAAPQIATVVAEGLMGTSIDDFRPDDPLTESDFMVLLASLGVPDVSYSDPDRLVTMRELDARLVTASGLRPEARYLREVAVEAGLAPTPYLGTESVARMLGLRLNHPRDQEQLELQLPQPATRAEAAYSVARLLTISDYDLQSVRDAVDAFVSPAVTDWQQAVLQRALHFVGSPYVWAGTSERKQRLYDGTKPGGFDCSGFVWRVYKTQPFPGARALAEVLKGRTTYAMSGEVPRSERIPFESLEPGDVVFFGSRGPSSRPSEIGHMGIYVGNGWFVHSSDRGVALLPMTGWYQTRFAWGRRPLAEAGLE